MSNQDICSLNYEEIQEEMKRIGEKAFRGRQIYEWLHVKLADDFSQMMWRRIRYPERIRRKSFCSSSLTAT